MTDNFFGDNNITTKKEITHQLTATWKTGNRVTIYFIENLPDELWTEKVPGYK